MFADRAAWDLSPNEMSRRLAARRASGRPFVDLTDTNPTRCGLRAPAALLREALVALADDPAALIYAPESRGAWTARSAIARDIATRGIAIDPEHIVLTAGTSEACAHLFRLLADPGDEVLVPAPGYPLFEQLAGLEGVGARPYASRRRADGGFVFDVDAVRDALGPRTRAVVVVHPNNPTGARVSRADAERLRALCRERGVALVVDEVFADFVTGDDPAALPSFLAGADDANAPPGFVLSGISKSLAMPGLKLAWIVVTGPGASRDEALARLDVIADAFLSVTTPGQWLLPRLLPGRAAVQSELIDRLQRNRCALEAAIAREPALRVLPSSAGWSAIVEVSDPVAVPDEDALVAHLLDEADVLVQPGWLFDLEPTTRTATVAHLVVSLLAEPAVFAAGCARLAGHRAGLGRGRALGDSLGDR